MLYGPGEHRRQVAQGALGMNGRRLALGRQQVIEERCGERIDRLLHHAFEQALERSAGSGAAPLMNELRSRIGFDEIGDPHAGALPYQDWGERTVTTCRADNRHMTPQWTLGVLVVPLTSS